MLQKFPNLIFIGNYKIKTSKEIKSLPSYIGKIDALQRYSVFKICIYFTLYDNCMFFAK